ncbi:MAG: 30S ribosomal protein S17 [Thermoplasmata archaeon]|jgi:small subunit ribosomal protein S17|nr:30S ribosomal protein S17 [Thermoplasmata archaeon]
MAEKVKKTTKPGVRDIGLDVEQPKITCKDKHCPFHGTLPVRGTVLSGTVVSAKMQSTVVIQREYMRYIPKFERYEKRTSKYMAHAPPCLQTKLGDKARIMECRPLSKRVSYVVIENKQ